MENFAPILDNLNDEIINFHKQKYSFLYKFFEGDSNYNKLEIYWAIKQLILNCWNFYKEHVDTNKELFYKLPIIHGYCKLPERFELINDNIYIEMLLGFVNYYLLLIEQDIAKSLGYYDIVETDFLYLILKPDGTHKKYDHYNIVTEIYPKLHIQYPYEFTKNISYELKYNSIKDINKLTIEDIDFLKKKKELDIKLEKIREVLEEKYFVDLFKIKLVDF